MQYFQLNAQFDDFKSLLATKKLYESASNSLLVTGGSKKLIGDSALSRAVVYENIVYKCKAGKERPTQSIGLRKSSTLKKGCPVNVSFVLGKI